MNYNLKEANDLDARLIELRRQLAEVQPEPVNPKLLAKEKELDKRYYDLCNERRSLDQKLQAAKDKAIEGTRLCHDDQDKKALIAMKQREEIKAQISSVSLLFNTSVAASQR